MSKMFTAISIVIVSLAGCGSLKKSEPISSATSREVLSQPQSVTAREIDRNKEILLRAHGEVWSKGRLALVDEFYDGSYICHFSGGEEWKGVAGLKSNIAGWRKKFPDWCETVDEVIAEGAFVVSRFTSTGTHSGAGDPDLAGKKVCISEIAIHRFEDGKIVEQWGLWDFESLKKQLGERSDY